MTSEAREEGNLSLTIPTPDGNQKVTPYPKEKCSVNGGAMSAPNGCSLAEVFSIPRDVKLVSRYENRYRRIKTDMNGDM